jgi:hypothetical protein
MAALARVIQSSFGVSSRRLSASAQDHRVFFREKGDYLEITRVLDRKEAYR